MQIIVKDQAELKRIRKLCSTLDNKSIQFPLIIYAVGNEAAAFMNGRPDREFCVTTKGDKVHFQMSDRVGARWEWRDREVQDLLRQADEFRKRLNKEGIISTPEET